MTMATAAFSTYDAIGIREDLSDLIYNISPVEVPFVSNCGKRSAAQTKFEWQTDSLAAAITTNAVLEGDDTAASAVTPTIRLANYTQIAKKVFTITGTEERVKKAGRQSEIAYQTAKKGKELKRDMEASLTSSQVAVAGGTTTIRKTAAFDSWLITNTNNGNSVTGDYTYTGTPITARTAATTANIRTWTETIFKDVISKTWTSGGEADMVLVNSFQKQKASGFTGLATLRHETGTNTVEIVGGADVYKSDFGDLKFMPDRFMPTDRAYHMDKNYVAIATLRPFFTEELAKTGDSRKFHMIVEYGLEMNNEMAHGVARDLATA